MIKLNNVLLIIKENIIWRIKTLPDKSIDLIMTDPPYLIENTNGGAIVN